MRNVVTTFVVILISLLNPAQSVSQENRSIEVGEIVPHLVDQELAISAEFRNLFSKKIVGTIHSGLPSIVQVEIKIRSAQKKNVARARLTKTISYDLWEERYTIKNGATQTLTNFDSVKATSNKLDHKLISLQELDANTSYQLDVRVGIVPITENQAEKVTGWLLAPNQTQEEIASEQRTSGFQLNLNKLVSFFVSNRQPSVFTSRWFNSKAFKISDLKK